MLETTTARPSTLLRDAVNLLDQALAASTDPNLTAILQRVSSDLGWAWSVAGVVEDDELRGSREWEAIIDFQRAALEF